MSTPPFSCLPPPSALRRRQWLALCGALAATAASSMAGCAAQDVAPEATYVLLDGSRLSTSDFKGKVTLINFWATTCVSCVKEMPDLVATYNRFKDRGYDTVAVAMSYDPPAYVAHFAQTRQLPFKVALDHTGAVSKAWGDIKVTPTTFLVDQRGRVVKRYVGPPDFAALHRLLEEMLAKG